MSLVVANNLALSFGENIVLDDVSFRIAYGDRVGLIGPNGSGKSTLLRVLAGESGLDSGSIQFSRDCSIGYLPQDILEIPETTVLRSVLDSVPGRKDLDERLQHIIQQIETSTSPDEQMTLAEDLARVQSRLDHFELHYSEHEALKILTGLGFLESDFERPIHEFSGGWRMRVALASILFRKPDLILLDEPTNHLDMPSVIWFDDFLRQFEGATILVSHDRYFLNKQINRVISFEVEGIRGYAGNYDTYRTQREEEEELLKARAKNVKKELKDLERFVERFKAKATKARQAQSRVKMIERLEKQAPKLIQMRPTITFTFPEVKRTGMEVITLSDLKKQFAEHVVFSQLEGQVLRKDRIAIIGKNGIGKTTLLKLMAGELHPEQGSITSGHNVDMRYYAQHHAETLNKQNSVLTETQNEVPTLSQTYVRNVLGAFLFRGDDVEKPIGVLSGGEKARVALAKLLVKPGNVLLMDEPTNHLDVDSSEALAEALKSFDGTILFVSHNRSFIDHLATRIWDLTPTGIIDYPGNLNRYLEHLEAVKNSENKPSPEVRKSPASEKKKKQVQPSKKATAPDPNDQVQQKKQWEQDKKTKRERERKRKEKNRRLKHLKKKVASLEKKIEDSEEKLKSMENQLANPVLYHQNPDQFNKLMNEYSAVKKNLDRDMSDWEQSLKSLEKLEE